jgi:S1-C subfamily serine protease
MDIETKRERMLYPVVRVKCAEGSGGSGTVIYSEPDPENKDQYITLVLTNWHVIEKLITQKEEWDSLVKKTIQKEYFRAATVEIFQYIGRTVLSTQDKGRLVAYNEHHDLAVLRLDSPLQFPYAATLIPEKGVDEIETFTPVVAVGCSLLHDPIPAEGIISYRWEEIEEQGYLMSTASIIFGNSGGALFLGETGELIGVPSRVTIQSMGFSSLVANWMGFSAHPARVYEFLREQELNFLAGDKEDDYYKAIERREQRKRQALLQLKAEALQQASHDSSDDD